MSAAAGELLGAISAISLDDLEQRAALLKRVDRKYVLEPEAFTALIERVAGGHDVLEIDGRRVFAYRSMYFDTPDLRCFHDHVADRQPRFKARTRLYRDTGLCHFEVKLKLGDGETDKRRAEHPPERADHLTDGARGLLAEALGGAGIEPPDDVRAVLRTRFHRATLAARDSPARLTCDVEIAMETLEGRMARIRDGLVLLESKSDDGDAPADHVLAELGVEPVSMSKYRVGIDLLVERDPSGDLGATRELFRVR